MTFRLRCRHHHLAVIVTTLVIGLLLSVRAIDRDLNHDEHQFLAPGALLARFAMLPYRDYPLFHLPNLTFVYAGLDLVSGNLILAAKLLSVLCTTLVLGFVVSTGLPQTSGRPQFSNLLFALALLLILLCDPLFLFTTGKTWNHEAPMLFVAMAILFYVEAARRVSSPLAFLSGLCISVAIGFRLTFAPLGIPFLVVLPFLPLPLDRKLRIAIAWSFGAFCGAIPTLYCFATAPEQFLFNNFAFPRLRLLDPENTRIQKTMTAWRKLRFFWKEIVRESWPLFLTFSVIAVRPAIQWFRYRTPEQLGSALTLLAIPFAVLGCFLPSRYQYQHFYGVIILIGLAIAFAIRELPSASRHRYFLCAMAGISLFFGIRGYPDRDVSARQYVNFSLLARPHDWFPSKAHALGQELRQHVKAGPVLTLAPAWVLEGGLSIYPEFATGPFAWRSATFASQAARAKMQLVAPADLEQFLAKRPPAAIWTGWEEPALEKQFIEFAERHHYHPMPLSKRRTLWLAVPPPVPSPLRP